jgi:hypothetical protein
MRRLLCLTLGAVALATTLGISTIAPASAHPRCGWHSHWVPGHRGHDGRWIAGHCRHN